MSVKAIDLGSLVFDILGPLINLFLPLRDFGVLLRILKGVPEGVRDSFFGGGKRDD